MEERTTACPQLTEEDAKKLCVEAETILAKVFRILNPLVSKEDIRKATYIWFLLPIAEIGKNIGSHFGFMVELEVKVQAELEYKSICSYLSLN